MRQNRRHTLEPNSVYVELVAASYSMLVPAAIMATIFVGVGIFCARQIGGPIAWTAILVGLITALSRLGVILAYRRQCDPRIMDRKVAGTWELRLALTTMLFATSLAVLGARSFSSTPSVQMLSTGLLFGFCSGAVARGYIRPRVCAACVTVATLPIALAAVLHGGTAYCLLAGLFIAFLLGSLETIRYAYRLRIEQITLRNKLTLVARHDPMTAIANRFGLSEAFEDLLEARGDQPMLAVHCIDLDRFKPVNDRFGHPTGDALLRMLADRLRAQLRPYDVAARMGGDEFLVVQAGINHADEAEMFARRLVRAISAPYSINGEIVEIGVSLGYVTSPPHAAALEDLLPAADAILYRVKRAGGGVGSAATAEIVPISQGTGTAG